MVNDFEKNLKKKDKGKAVSGSESEPEPKKKARIPSPRSASPEEKKNDKNDKVEGSYDDNDSAKEIINIRKDNDTKVLEFYVAWKTRKNSKAP